MEFNLDKLPNRPCGEALKILKKLKPTNLKEAWEKYPRGDHLFWFVRQLGIERKFIVLAACACAEQALVHVPRGEERNAEAIAAARALIAGIAAASTAVAGYNSAAATDAFVYAAFAHVAGHVAGANAARQNRSKNQPISFVPIFLGS
jgi:hypothetical protein